MAQPEVEAERRGAVVAARILFALVLLTFVAPLLPEPVLQYGGADTGSAFYFRCIIELGLPLYAYLLLTLPQARPRLRSPLTLSILGFLVLSTVSLAAGVNPGSSFWGSLEHMDGVFQLIHLTGLYFYVLLLCTLHPLWSNRLLLGFIPVPVVVACIGLLGKLHWPAPVQEMSLPRVGSTLYNPDYLGAYLLIPVFLAVLAMFMARRRSGRIAAASAVALLGIGLALSEARGAMLGLLAGLAVAACIVLTSSGTRPARRTGIGVLAGACAGLVTLFAVREHLPAALQRILTIGDADTTSRLLNWSIALHGYPAHPLFGVGPENYYYLSSLNYSPAIYAYDPSYLARPHNYFLELLVTSGPPGLLAYLAMVALAFRALHIARQRGVVGVKGLALLAGGLVAYEVQMFTLFTTVAAEIAFFLLLGVAEAMSGPSAAGLAAASVPPRWRRYLPVTAAGAVALAGVAMVNLPSAETAAATATAEADSSADVQAAAGAYQDAGSKAPNFYESELALSFANFAANLAENRDAAPPEFARRELGLSIALSNRVATSDPTNARNWIDLANDYLAQSISQGAPLQPAQAALNHAQALEPQRPEPRLLQADILTLENRLPEAQGILEQLAATFPGIERVDQRLAYVLQAQGRAAEGVRWFEAAERLGYVPPTLASAQWVGRYYDQSGQFSKEVSLYQVLLRNHPADLDAAVALANAYEKDGQVQAAETLYAEIVAIDPGRAASMPGINAS